jgi:hypothetical protein
MPKKNFKKQKDEFDDLDEGFRGQVEAADSAEVRKMIADVALAQNDLMEAQKNDFDLQEKRKAASEANFVYSDGTKQNRLKIRFARAMLSARGAI